MAKWAFTTEPVRDESGEVTATAIFDQEGEEVLIVTAKRHAEVAECLAKLMGERADTSSPPKRQIVVPRRTAPRPGKRRLRKL